MQQEVDPPQAVDGDAATESKLLRREMVAIVVENMQAQGAQKKQGELQVEAEKVVAEEIAKARKRNPDFLIVSARVERDLEQGVGPADGKGRIDRAHQALVGFELPGAAKVLMSQHKAGTLNAVRTELLAQLLEQAVKVRDAAIIGRP
jgi:hypothetical protein